MKKKKEISTSIQDIGTMFTTKEKRGRKKLIYSRF
jgi:hypothetical protein